MKPFSRKPQKLNPVAEAATAVRASNPQPTPRPSVTFRQEQVTTIFEPEVLRKYQAMVPDAPERVLRVFEQNAATEREIRTIALKAQVADNRRRDWMAFGIIFGGLAVSAIFAWLDKPWHSGATLVAIAAYSTWGFLIKRGKAPPPQP